MLWAQSTTKDYNRAEHKLHSSPSYSFHKSSYHKSCFFEHTYIPRALNTGTCLGRDPQWRAADAEVKSHLVRTQSLNVLPFKPGVGQYIAIHAALTARDFFLAYFYLLVHSPAFFPNLSQFFLCSLLLTHGSCVGPQNKIGHPAGCRFPC